MPARAKAGEMSRERADPGGTAMPGRPVPKAAEIWESRARNRARIEGNGPIPEVPQCRANPCQRQPRSEGARVEFSPVGPVLEYRSRLARPGARSGSRERSDPFAPLAEIRPTRDKGAFRPTQAAEITETLSPKGAVRSIAGCPVVRLARCWDEHPPAPTRGNFGFRLSDSVARAI